MGCFNIKHFLLAAIGCIFFISGCLWLSPTKELDLKSFTITVPKNWSYKPTEGIDSFVGEIIGPFVNLNFDFSEMGYANSLIQTEQDFIKAERYSRSCNFCKPGITYISEKDATKAITDEMRRTGIKNRKHIKIAPNPVYETKETIRSPLTKEKAKFHNPDFIADLTYQDSTISVPVNIPEDIKSHNFRFDTTSKFIIKTVWPKFTGKGMTGIYIKSKTSALNFKMSAYNLPKQQQDEVLKAFKTIQIKGELVSP
ncbi:hypothetical protein FPZ43_12515 [Mucilaginibacter pallidiroseus]|uniref:Lipoprotein n=1 Tax=Mucilaginibacter pallidiroseus TaxID=2599295 RepID=A0A563UCH9_9SPHI|nr:hypothetical protein [Mucilaginibacter pallidiroseus]TWR29077.1 hypothetical protein FPZ43_12515 [Mucilaginibacter pallidiroseus]